MRLYLLKVFLCFTRATTVSCLFHCILFFLFFFFFFVLVIWTVPRPGGCGTIIVVRRSRSRSAKLSYVVPFFFCLFKSLIVNPSESTTGGIPTPWALDALPPNKEGYDDMVSHRGLPRHHDPRALVECHRHGRPWKETERIHFSFPSLGLLFV